MQQPLSDKTPMYTELQTKMWQRHETDSLIN